MCVALVLLISETLGLMVEVNIKWYKEFGIGLKRFEWLKLVIWNKQWLNSKTGLDCNLDVKSDTFWVGIDTQYILQITEERNYRMISGLTLYEYFFGGWLNVWYASWFISLWKSPTWGEERRNDVEDDTWLIEKYHSLRIDFWSISWLMM